MIHAQGNVRYVWVAVREPVGCDSALTHECVSRDRQPVLLSEERRRDDDVAT